MTRTIGYGKWETWHFIAAAAFAALAVVLTLPAWRDIYQIATLDEEQSHIFLVPVVSAWMFWARRLRLRTCPPAGTFIGPMIVALGFFSYVFGYNNAVASMWHAGAVAIVVGCVLTVLGKNVLFQFLPAFVVLVFIVPIPGVIRQQVSGPLQVATAIVTQVILDIFSVPLERTGNVLVINGRAVAVAEACNGMRMIFALVLVSYAFAFSIPLRNTTRLLVLVCSPVAALICNVIRLIPTVLVYGYQAEGSKMGDQFHDWSGWFMLPIAFMLLMVVMRALKWALLPVMRFNLAYQ